MRILIADDENMSRWLLVQLLVALGHEVTAATDGEEAWAKFRAEPFPVVITDGSMPRAGGAELARRIRGLRNRNYTWIILLNCDEQGGDVFGMMESGVDDVIRKPVDREHLRVRLAVAERVQRMGEQVRALASALPMCMHCKAVRTGSDQWKRVEEYFYDVDFSHAYCPDCFYQHSLVTELRRMEHEDETGGLPEPDEDATLDERVVEALIDFDRRDSPGLFEDLADGLRECAQRLRSDLSDFGRTGILPEHTRQRFERFRVRCLDVGAGRMASHLVDLATLEPAEQLLRHGPLASAALEELDALMMALNERQSGRTAPASPAA